MVRRYTGLTSRGTTFRVSRFMHLGDAMTKPFLTSIDFLGFSAVSPEHGVAQLFRHSREQHERVSAMANSDHGRPATRIFRDTHVCE